MAKVKPEIQEVETLEINTRRVEFCIMGTTPLIMNRFSEKARQEMLMPAQKKNRAEKASSLKHDPVAEYRRAAYRNRNPESPTAFHMPTGAFHKAAGQAAVDLPGQAKSVMLRLTSVTSANVDIYGIPSMLISMVRSGGMGNIPDMRTRPIFAEWACRVQFDLVSSLINQQQLMNLVAAAGVFVGIGDWRPEKKGGPYGKYTCVSPQDENFLRIVEQQGREPQLEAFECPEFYDSETEELFLWFEEEAKRRELPYTPMIPGAFKMAAE